MKLYKVDFAPMWPVPCGLVLLAENDEQAKAMAKELITHTDEIYEFVEIPMTEARVVFYENGDY